MAQSHFQHFDQITTQQGLVNNIVNDIVQDDRGYIWIASWGGLQRYDGKNFLTYSSQKPDSNALESDIVLRLLPDNNGHLWIVTAKGIGYYYHSSKKFVPVSTKEIDLPFMAINNFFEDTHGTIWLSDEDKGLFFCDDPKNGFQPYFEKWPTFNHSFATILEATEKNGFWIGADHGLSFFNLETHAYEPAPFALKFATQKEFHQPIKYLTSDGADGLWVVTDTETIHYRQHLQTWSREAWSHQAIPWQVLPTTSGDAWAIGESVLHFNKDARQWKEYLKLKAEHSALPEQEYELRNIFEDRDGSLWIGSNNGVFVFTPDVDKFSYYAIPLATTPAYSNNELSNTFKASILETHDATIIVSLFRGGATGFAKFDTAMNPLPLNKSLKNTCQSCRTPALLFEDSRNNLWIACHPGQLGKIDPPHNDINWIRSPEFENASFTSVAEDRHGNLWWATDKNIIVKWDRANNRYEETVNLQFFTAFTGGTLLKIDYDPIQNCFWLTTTKQIIRFVEFGDAAFHQPPQNIDITDVNAWDNDFTIVGSAQGIYLFNKKNGGSFQGFVVEGQPFTYHVTSLAKDAENNIWVGTRGNGLFKILNSRTKAIAFGKQDGVTFSSAYSGLKQLQNGFMVAGVPGGLLYVHPASLQIARTKPKVMITSLTVNDSDVDIDFDSTLHHNLKLDWNENSVGIEFSSLSYYYSGKVTYQYQLEGIDTKWQYSRGAEKIKYSELPPGTYRFRVQSQSILSEEISDEATLSFVIATPIWETWYFQVTVAMTIILLISYIYYTQIQRVLLVQRIRNRISSDLHDHIGSSLSSISMLLKVVSASVTTKPVADLLKKISDTAHLTQENLHDIVWSINSKNSSMVHIITRMQEFMHSIFEGQDVQLKFQASEKVQQEDLRLDKRYDLYLIFKELVNNGAKYAQAKNVAVTVERLNEYIELVYQDDGVGFDALAPTNGNGLENMKQRARNLGGQFLIQTAIGHGTRVLIRFPVK